MEAYILIYILVFVVGIALGVIGVLLFSKYKTGSLSSTAVKKEYEAYQGDVEKHFEETSQRLQEMTTQYQELYKHLAVGATTLCRPDSVAAGIAHDSEPELKLENQSGDKANIESEASKSDEQIAEEKADITQEEAEAPKLKPQPAGDTEKLDDANAESKIAEQASPKQEQSTPDESSVESSVKDSNSEQSASKKSASKRNTPK